MITKTNGTVSSGTLLVANGSLLPVIPQPTLVPAQTIITNPTPIVVNPAPNNNTTLFVVSKSDKDVSVNSHESLSCTKTPTNSKATNVLKSLPLLRPKSRDLTKTTHVNKLPIPALTSRYANNLISQVNIAQNTKTSKIKRTKKESSTKSKPLENTTAEKPAEVQTNNSEEAEGSKDKNQCVNEKTVLITSQPKDNNKNDESNDNTEPALKKTKLNSQSACPENNDNKKINIISAYTIDSLCNDLADASNVVTQQLATTNPNIKEIEKEISEKVELTKSEIQDKSDETPVSVPRQSQTTTETTEVSKNNISVSTNCVITSENVQQNKDVNKDKSKENQKSPEVNNHLIHSDLSNDIFATLSHVSTGGGQNPESTSPTAAFLLAFPLVSSLNSLKVAEVIDDEGADSQHGTPTLLQIGTMDTTKPTQSQADNLTPNLLNLDNFSFFSKEFYPTFDPVVTSSSASCHVTAATSTNTETKKDFLNFNVNHEEKKTSTSEHLKNDFNYTLKSISSRESSGYANNVKSMSQNVPTNSVCQSTSMFLACQNSTVTSSCSSVSTNPLCRNIPVASICQSLPTKPICSNVSTSSVYPSVSLNSVCSQSTTSSSLNVSTNSIYSNSSAISSRPNISIGVTICSNPSTISACLTAPTSIPNCESSVTIRQNASILSITSQSTSMSAPSQTSVAVCQSTSILPSLSHTTSMMTGCQNSSIISQCHSEMPHLTTYVSCPSMDYNATCNQPFYNSAQTITTSSTTTMTSVKHQSEKPKIPEKKTYNYYPTTTAYSVSQYNTFNPFTDIPKSTNYSISTKPYNESLYTNNTSYSYNYHSDNFIPSYSTNKTNIKSDKLYYGLNYDNYEYKHNEFQKYDTRNQQFGSYYNQNQHHHKDKTIVEPVNKNNVNTGANSKVPVNWMTTPDTKQPQNDFIVPSLGKEMDFASNSIYSSNSFNTPQTTYFNANAGLYGSNDLHNTASFPTIPTNSFQRNDLEENQFTWSPSKIPQLLDTTHNFMSGTLPTLVGDLALGNTQPFVEQKVENKNAKEYRSKESTRRSKPQTNYDNQTNFLSVSQLVDHNKNDSMPSKVSNRRNSGNRTNKISSNNKSSKRMPKTDKDMHNFNGTNKISDKQIKHNNQEYQGQNSGDNNAHWMSTNKSRNIKMPSSNYSAEALIGHQNHTELNRNKNQQNYPVMNKSLPVPFLTDNIIPYFPMDIPQENALGSQNQNYQSNTFAPNFSSGIQGGVYPNSSFVPNPAPITTSYLPSTNFIPDIGGNTDYTSVIPDNSFTHAVNKNSDKYLKNKQLETEKSEKRNLPQQNMNCNINPVNSLNKKSKKKQHNEPNLSNFDFSFLSMPAAINSPILPDDFHAHTNFLPPPTPTQLYPCKNPLYGKQELGTNNLLPIPPTVSRSAVAHPEISPSLNNVGTALTNFNLSTIFPEINKVRS